MPELTANDLTKFYKQMSKDREQSAFEKMITNSIEDIKNYLKNLNKLETSENTNLQKQMVFQKNYMLAQEEQNKQMLNRLRNDIPSIINKDIKFKKELNEKFNDISVINKLMSKELSSQLDKTNKALEKYQLSDNDIKKQILDSNKNLFDLRKQQISKLISPSKMISDLTGKLTGKLKSSVFDKVSASLSTTSKLFDKINMPTIGKLTTNASEAFELLSENEKEKVQNIMDEREIIRNEIAFEKEKKKELLKPKTQKEFVELSKKQIQLENKISDIQLSLSKTSEIKEKFISGESPAVIEGQVLNLSTISDSVKIALKEQSESMLLVNEETNELLKQISNSQEEQKGDEIQRAFKEEKKEELEQQKIMIDKENTDKIISAVNNISISTPDGKKVGDDISNKLGGFLQNFGGTFFGNLSKGFIGKIGGGLVKAISNPLFLKAAAVAAVAVGGFKLGQFVYDKVFKEAQEKFNQAAIDAENKRSEIMVQQRKLEETRAAKKLGITREERKEITKKVREDEVLTQKEAKFRKTQASIIRKQRVLFHLGIPEDDPEYERLLQLPEAQFYGEAEKKAKGIFFDNKKALEEIEKQQKFMITSSKKINKLMEKRDEPDTKTKKQMQDKVVVSKEKEVPEIDLSIPKIEKMIDKNETESEQILKINVEEVSLENLNKKISDHEIIEMVSELDNARGTILENEKKIELTNLIKEKEKISLSEKRKLENLRNKKIVDLIDKEIIDVPFKDTSTITTKPFKDTSTITTKPFKDTSTITTDSFRDDSINITRPFVDTSTITTKPFKDTSTITTDSFRDDSINITRPFVDTSTITTDPFKDKPDVIKTINNEIDKTKNDVKKINNNTNENKNVETIVNNTVKQFENKIQIDNKEQLAEQIKLNNNIEKLISSVQENGKVKVVNRVVSGKSKQNLTQVL